MDIQGCCSKIFNYKEWVGAKKLFLELWGLVVYIASDI